MSSTLLAHFVVGPLACNCYIVGDPQTREAIVIDPGGDAAMLLGELARLDVTVTAIVATHAHFDHLIAGEELRAQTGAPFHLHSADRFLLDWWYESGLLFLGTKLPPPPAIDADAAEGLVLTAGEAKLEVLHTPGHSPGSVSFVGQGMVFGGDVLFNGSVGRTDLPGGDWPTLLESIRTLVDGLPAETTVYPGHMGITTLGAERATNPFLTELARG